MPKFKPRTKAQNSAFHKLLGQHKFDAEAKAEMVFDITKERTDSSSKMSFDEMNFAIERLGGTPFPVSSRSRRTLQYQRQQQGIEQIVTQAHLNKLEKLWFAIEGRTAVGLRQLCYRMLKDKQGNHLYTPRTTKECNKVVEAVKAMNSRPTAAATETATVTKLKEVA